jgi:hypothetical protein
MIFGTGRRAGEQLAAADDPLTPLSGNSEYKIDF